MALPKQHRLKSRQDFQAVFREGIRRHGSIMTLRALRPLSRTSSSQDSADLRYAQRQADRLSPELSPTKIGISISTKVSKRAVVRNRIKRQISAILFDLLPKIAPGWRLVFIVKPTAVEQTCGRQQFLQELEQLLRQTEVLNGHS